MNHNYRYPESLGNHMTTRMRLEENCSGFIILLMRCALKRRASFFLNNFLVAPSIVMPESYDVNLLPLYVLVISC